jgi:hypothetical protein
MLKIQTQSKVSAEVGPIKYVAQQVNQPVDSVVNWFILLFIFVFDPLAVMLLIASNRLFETKDPLSDVIPEVVEEESKADRVKAPTPSTSPQPAVADDIYQEEKQKQKRVIIRSEIK